MQRLSEGGRSGVKTVGMAPLLHFINSKDYLVLAGSQLRLPELKRFEDERQPIKGLLTETDLASLNILCELVVLPLYKDRQNIFTFGFRY